MEGSTCGTPAVAGSAMVAARLSGIKGKRAKWVIVSLTLFAIGGITICNQPQSPFSAEFDTLSVMTASPDGHYAAKLYYRENRALTYGYYHVTIETTGFSVGPSELVEVAAEGLDGLEWKANRTLVVRYSPTEADFVQQPKSWGDVRIEYLPMADTEPDASEQQTSGPK